MVQRSVSMPLDLWQQARQKAIAASERGSLSEVLQKFLRLWIAGKINLDEFDD